MAYDRPTRVYRNTNTRIVNRDVNVRNVRYNNERVVRDRRSSRDDVRRTYPERRVQTQERQYTRQRQRTPETIRVRSDQRDGRQVTVQESRKRKVRRTVED